MASQIVASARRFRVLIEADKPADEIIEVVRKFAQASIYRAPKREVEQLRDRIVRLVSRQHIPYAAQIGRAAARPILSAMGGQDAVRLGNRFRGPVLRNFERYTRRNLAVFQAELIREVGYLEADINAAFARASRDGIARQQVIADLLAADREELEQLANLQRRLRRARQAYAQAEATGTPAEIRAARREVSNIVSQRNRTAGFLPRFAVKVAAHNRDAIRREAQRAQYSSFRAAGYTGTFVWVTVNGSESCPSCIDLHGTESNNWAGRMPGDGHTFCKDACMCQLVPIEYTDQGDTSEPLNPYQRR
jgi:hypothetical protein